MFIPCRSYQLICIPHDYETLNVLINSVIYIYFFLLQPKPLYAEAYLGYRDLTEEELAAFPGNYEYVPSYNLNVSARYSRSEHNYVASLVYITIAQQPMPLAHESIRITRCESLTMQGALKQTGAPCISWAVCVVPICDLLIEPIL